MPINRAFAPFFEGDKGDRRVTGFTLSVLLHSGGVDDSSVPLSSLAAFMVLPVKNMPVCT